MTHILSLTITQLKHNTGDVSEKAINPFEQERMPKEEQCHAVCHFLNDTSDVGPLSK
jgi:hypothetical protein